MSGGTTEVHRDTEPLITGTHKGATDSVLTDTDFSNLRSFGVRAGLYIENVTKGATGTVASVSGNSLTVNWLTGATTPATGDITFGSDNLTFGSDDVYFSEMVGGTLDWSPGDIYAVYKTATKNGIISTNWVDLSRGWKSRKKELREGWRPRRPGRGRHQAGEAPRRDRHLPPLPPVGRRPPARGHRPCRGAGEELPRPALRGLGKSNTIAWLAHRLMSLHGADDRPVFDKVVVITDRVILDRQLQETIYQFEHATGVVARIDADGTQLATALSGEQSRIVITTLQKFPFILDKVTELGRRRFAVIVDEAHSSQTGEAAKELRAALGATSAEAALEAAEASELAGAPGDPQDALAASVAARGRQPNMSFFAFTATPKARTLELFGRNEDGNHAPFHLYSMRQAIEEGFILDVLANYTTYAVYWKVGKAVEDDPEYDSRKAKRAIARWAALHPHNLAQKAELVVEHFRDHTRHKIGGRGKAMVVTSCRLHAVRYKQAIDSYIAQKGYADTKALVAFSGTVGDGGLDWTESGMNEVPESQTAETFAGPDYGVLVVAEKFQTGYDQPLLHTMFVDKPLVGLNAVQTLSRLNRIHPDKTDTFVLDFRNEADAITEAFEPWYEATVAVPTDPNILHDMADRLLGLQVIDMAEAHAIAALIADRTVKAGDHGAIYALLAAPVERFKALEPSEQHEVRDALDAFVRAYAFLSQVVEFGDVGLEALYLASRALAAELPSDGGGRLDLGSEVQLTHLRIEQTSSGLDHPRRRLRPDRVALLRAGQAGRRGEGPPLDDHRGPQRALRHGARHRGPALLRPARGDLDGRRPPGRPGAGQPDRELPPRLPAPVPQEHRGPDGRQRGHLQARRGRPGLPGRGDEPLPDSASSSGLGCPTRHERRAGRP